MQTLDPGGPLTRGAPTKRAGLAKPTRLSRLDSGRTRRRAAPTYLRRRATASPAKVSSASVAGSGIGVIVKLTVG